MIGYKGWFIDKRNGVAMPVIIVGFEGDNLIVWKLINGIVLERVVSRDKIFLSEEWRC